jgi:hypothetical protein
MSILKVIENKAGTELDGYDISYRVVVDAESTEDFTNGDVIYSSRFADKAVVKAVVLTADQPYLGFTVAVDPEVATAAGVRNLEQRVKAEKLDALTQIVNAEFDAAQAVEFIKTVQG